MKRRTVVLVALVLLATAGQITAATNLAVFNFQLKTGQEDWVWLEKFMSDQMATDLVQDRSLSVIARDRMQLIAQKMKWTPEFATGNAKVMGRIRSQLRIEYLVTGVCSVQGDQLEITGQIVEVASRKEVFRKTVTGKTGQVIDLQKQLSAEVMSWFTKKPAGAILKTLPMWTRSIPAIRALYEGMHLYDQGRYAEGWLKFRESSREDKNYVEAVYWVGKMYYFLYRYEHARRTLERFVYLNCLHPRIGDAVTEYAHTFESTGTTREELLALYGMIRERFPSVMMTGPKPKTVQKWASAKLTALLPRRLSDREEDVLKGIAEQQWSGVEKGPRIFSPDALTHTIRFGEPRRVYGRATLDRDKEAIFRKETCYLDLPLQASADHVFTSLRFKLLAQGADAKVTVALRDPDSRFLEIDSVTVSLPEASTAGIVLRPVPRRAALTAKCMIAVKGAKARLVAVKGIAVSATLEKVAEHGALEVQCTNTDDFRVDVDGAFGRWSSGHVGLLSPGRHQVTVRPAHCHTPCGSWEASVEIEAGKVTRVVAVLPWQDQARGTIATGRILPQRTPAKPYPFRYQQGPVVHLDDQCIRMIWSQGGDLWLSTSSDGNSFSDPEMLAVPVSTAWTESDPHLFRDESGRYILTFVSDRDGQHRRLVYICWSRDLVRWSNPSVISEVSCRDHDIVQAPDGRLYCAIGDTPHDWTMVTLLSSSNGYRWEKMPGKQIAFNMSNIQIVPRSDGTIELYAVPALPGRIWPRGHHQAYKFRMRTAYKQLVRFVHNGSEWSPKEIMTGFIWDEAPDHISLTRDNQGLIVLATTGSSFTSFGYVQIVREKEGHWQSTGPVKGFVMRSGELAYHSRWGYVMSHGGYFKRSRQLPELFAAAAAKTPKPILVEPPFSTGTVISQYRRSGGKLVQDLGIQFVPPKARPPRRRKQPPPKPGEVRYKTPGNYVCNSRIQIDDEKRLAKPTPGCGTVHPNAVVVTMEHNGLPIALALDSDDPNSVHYELVRCDFSGKGDFRKATVVHRESMFFYPPTKRFETIFKAKPTYVTLDGRIVPAEIVINYVEKADRRTLALQMRALAEGMCRFGDKQYKVEIYDDNNNLRLGDATWPGSQKGYDTVHVSVRPGIAPTVRYGEPVSIDGKLYDVRISADGNSVTALDYKGPAGLLKIGRPAWNAWLICGKTRFTVAGGMDPIPVPPGEYKLVSFNEFSSSDTSKPRYRLHVGGPINFRLKSGETASVDIGSPMRTKLMADVSGRAVKFRYNERDTSGNGAEFYRPGQDVPARERHLKIVDSNNKPVIGLWMDSGYASCRWNVRWTVRKGLSGTFTATVESDSGPFIPKPATVTFTVK